MLVTATTGLRVDQPAGALLPAVEQAIAEQGKKVSVAVENLKLEKERIQNLDEILKPLAITVTLVALMAIYAVVLAIPGGLPVAMAIYCAFYLTVISGVAICLATNLEPEDYSDDERLKEHVKILTEASTTLQKLKGFKLFFEKNHDPVLTEEFSKKQITNFAEELEKLKKAIEEKQKVVRNELEMQKNKNAHLNQFLSQFN